MRIVSNSTCEPFLSVACQHLYRDDMEEEEGHGCVLGRDTGLYENPCLGRTHSGRSVAK